MPTLGEKLRQARESREIPLDEIARETRIAARYLTALEKGELAELPGSTFAKGYLRTYAHYLGLDPEPLVEIYLEEEAEQTREGQIAPGPDVLEGLRKSVGRGGAGRGESLGKILRVGLPVFLVVGLVAVTIFLVLPWLRSSGSEREEGDEGARQAATSEAPRPAERAEPQEPGETMGAAPTAKEVAPPRPVEREARGVAPAKPVPEQETAAAAMPSSPQPTTPSPSPSRVITPPVSTDSRASASPQAPAAASEEGRLSVSEAHVGTAVVNRIVQGESDRFAEGTRIVFWTRVLGGQAGDEIRHVWIREGLEVGSVSLSIGAAHWRTHSRRTLSEGAAGSWAVEARDAEGRVLARREFRCEAGEGA